MKRVKVFVVCMALCLMSALGFAACGEPSNELTFDVAQSVTAEVGNYFDLPSVIGEDTNGSIYTPTIDVTDPNDEEVIVEDGKIFVDFIGEYKAKYTVLFNGEHVSKTTVVNSVDTSKPTIKLSIKEGYEIMGTDYTLPTPVYEDNYTTAADLITSANVKFADQAIEPVDGVIRLENEGEYLITYTAKDSSNNEISETLIINSFAGEDDNVTYFNREFGAENISLREGVGSVSVSEDRTLPGEDYSLKYSIGSTASELDNIRGIGGLFLNRPFIKDISSYDYLYFYVYTDTDNVGVTFNSIYSSNRLGKDLWNKIVLTKTTGSDGKIDYVTPWGTKVFYDAYSDKWVGDATDITDFLIYLYVPADTGANIWFSAIRGANALPQSEVEFNSTYTVGTEIDLPVATCVGMDNLTQEVFVKKGGVITKVTESKFTFSEAGSYLFTYYILSDGKLIDIVGETVLCIEEEVGNLTYFNHDFGSQNVSHGGFTGSSIASKDKVIPGEEYSLKHTNNSYFGNSAIVVDKAYQKDITEYKYLYFYIYIDKADSGITFNKVYSGDRSLIPGVWNRIVLTRNPDSTNYKTPWGGDVFGPDHTAKPTNMDGFMFYVYHPANVDTTIYLSAMRGTNTEPLNPEVLLAESVKRNQEFDIPTATGVENLTQKAYIISGDAAREITTAKYTITENGVYTFAFMVYSDGKLVNTVKKTVIVYDNEPDNLTYFNQSFGKNFATPWSTDTTFASSSDKSYGNELYSLKVSAPTPYWGVAGVYLDKCLINDISEYKYLYFYVYTDDENVKFNGTTTTVNSGIWNKVVLTRQDDGSYKSLVGYTISAARAENMNLADGDRFGILLSTAGTGEGAYEGVTFYISSVRVTNSLAEKDAVVNFSTSQGAGEVGGKNALAFGPTRAYYLDDEECSTEFYLQAPGFQPTVKLTAPAITNLNIKDGEGEYLYDYVYFYVNSSTSNTALSIHCAAVATKFPANTWTRVVLTRVGDTFHYDGVNVFGGEDGKTAADITNLGLCFNTLDETAYSSIYMTSWRAVKTLPTA